MTLRFPVSCFDVADTDFETFSGGPAGLVYSFIIVWIGNLATFATLAELVSM